MVKNLTSQAEGVASSGQQHSKYRILSQIGQGQFGRVFCANIRPTGEIVALKELSHHNSPTNKFLRELWSLITLRHPAIVGCLALEHTATGRYLVMDYCEGGTLRNLMEQDNGLKLAEALRLVIGILSGLEYTHRQGIVHCDMKPDNILLSLGSAGWLPKISDFGLAIRVQKKQNIGVHQELSHDLAMGTPAYMAPERFYGLYSPVSDVYAVGIMLFELLMGNRPFVGMPRKLMWAHLNERVEVPQTWPLSLQVIVKKSLEKLPARRYSSAAEMAQALREALDDPAVKSLKYQRVPLGSDSEDLLHLKPLPEVQRKTLRLASSFLSCCGPVICAAGGSFVWVWDSFSTPRREVDLGLQVCGLQVIAGGCLVMTTGGVFWLRAGVWEPQKIVGLVSDGYQAAVEPGGRWLALAKNGVLDVYSLLNWQDCQEGGDGVPVRSLPLKTENLSHLFFLDRRHIAVVFSDLEKKKTVFKIYNRRCQYLTSIAVPLVFENLIQGNEPYTLLGIEKGSTPAAYRIRLKPYQVTRILLESVPTLAAPIPDGWVLGTPQGKIWFLDKEGKHLGYLNGPKITTALAGSGKNNLLLASFTEDKNYLYNFQVDINLNFQEQE
ncbi:serine/threonine protein kinase [Ancylothrix sp. C2]|uniref:serine/threonine-protein kinase n=1 Tax=Ancylothrix sp. D3o TaxID=2953691 RepID=UPI0021BB1BF9|nr:serine/threonine-protein kinase [Ancylothrix sp. D3o]MCT7950633.1 serine/threonine protein kinase [Ancylothrix sp. D3o]